MMETAIVNAENAGKNSCPLNIKLNFLSEYIEVSVEYEKHCFIFLFD